MEIEMKWRLLAILAATLSGMVWYPAQSHAEDVKYSPDQEKGIRAWANSLATQAATFCASPVGMYNLRQDIATGASPKAKPNHIWRMPNISTPKLAKESGYVTPNVNTIYGFGFMDLAEEPVILTTPDSKGRYYIVQLVSMYDDTFAYGAGKDVGYSGGTYALVGPGWKGTLPSDVKRIDAPTRWVTVQPRVHVKNEADLPAAQKVLDAITVQGLSEYEGKSTPKAPTYNYVQPKLKPNVASSLLLFDDPLQFWSICVDAMNENPPRKDMVDAVLPQYKYLGIELGKPWKPENVLNSIFLDEMKKVGTAIGPMIADLPYLIGPNGNGWIVTPYNFGNPGPDYLTAAVHSVLGLTANNSDEAFYIWSQYDENLKQLTGENKYTMTFPASFPYTKVVSPGFWSVTMYDLGSKLTVENPINRYSLGSDNELKKNDDGSITIYLQATNPGKDKESNWLPAPKGPFYMLIRNYAPAPEAMKALKDPNAGKLLPKVKQVSN
ncbi:DUF1254 domain-containing protein [Methyloceanibacter methanicus]|nr:DUF1254 domain-containing protein [Methyloceanibacter methanicus]